MCVVRCPLTTGVSAPPTSDSRLRVHLSARLTRLEENTFLFYCKKHCLKEATLEPLSKHKDTSLKRTLFLSHRTVSSM